MSDEQERNEIEMYGAEKLGIVQHPEQRVSEDDLEDEVVDLGMNFDYDGFQVVRREFFAHINEPSLTFCDNKFYVNAACLRKFPTVDYILVLVNPESRIIALRPCTEFTRDALPWSKETKGKRVPKATTCKLLLAKLVTLLGWNPVNRYKLLGKMIRARGEYLIAFDLNAVEVYQRTAGEDGKMKTSRTASYAEDWKDQFGMSFTEHEQSLQINTFEGYVIFSVRNEKAAATQPAAATA